MTNVKVEQNNAINSQAQVQARATNPFGVENVDFLKDYQPVSVSQEQTSVEEQYTNFQRAEASYFTAGMSLGKSDILKQFNMMAKMQGYDKVNLIHRHDVD